MPKKATVSFELGRTINLGNFENVKITIGIDVETDTSSMTKDFEKAKEWVEGKLSKEEDKWEDERKK